MNVELLNEIWEGTYKVCTAGKYTVQSKTVDVSTAMTEPKENYVYAGIERIADILYRQVPVRQTCVRLFAAETLDVAFLLKRQGKNPVVLSMADDIHPGRGYRAGAFGEEETIFRRSNYFLFMDPPNNRPQPVQLYPIPEFGAVYSSNVLVFRAAESEGYAFLEHPFYVSIIAMGSYDLVDGQVWNEKYETALLYKMKTAMTIALNHQHDSIVLCAFVGNRNPPERVARLWRHVIEEFDGLFLEICFGIPDSHIHAYGGVAATLYANINFRVYSEVLRDKLTLPALGTV